MQEWHKIEVNSMANAQNLLETHRDGTMYKRLICECGNSLYKKNIKTGVIEFLARKGGKQIKPLPLNGVSQTEIFCERCGKGHLLVDVQEGMRASDDHSIHTDIAK